jgi:tRNA (cmo5U34)-methyltransferase
MALEKKQNSQNPWLDVENQELPDFYVDFADLFILERKRTAKIMVDIFGYHFMKPENLILLDLGCGDGALTKRIRERYPDNNFTLMDGSKAMIEKAAENLKGNNITFIAQNFEDYIAASNDFFKYDFIYTALATHHLDFLGKVALYSRIFKALNFGGLFINIDAVAPVSERSAEWQLRMWKDWISETVNRSAVENKEQKIIELHNIADNKNKDDMPSGLEDQIAEMRKIGFSDVDCYYKYGCFALFGGTKPS